MTERSQDVNIVDNDTEYSMIIDVDQDAHIKSKLWDGTDEVSITDNRLDVNITELDPYGVLPVILFEHNQIHEGHHFFMENGAEFALNETFIIAATTPNTDIRVHLTYKVLGFEEFQSYIYEGASITGGTSFIPLNSDRNSATASTVTIKINPTITVAGTQIVFHLYGDATGGGESKRENEIILKKNTTYIFKIVSKSSSNPINYWASWYEEEI